MCKSGGLKLMITHQASVGKLERMSLSPLDLLFLERHPRHFAKITGATQFLFTPILLDSCRLGTEEKNWAWWFQPVKQRTCHKGPVTGWMSDSLFLPFLLTQRDWLLSVLSTETPENFACDVVSALISLHLCFMTYVLVSHKIFPVGRVLRSWHCYECDLIIPWGFIYG